MVMKVLAFSSIRADYDLLSPLYKRLNEDPSIDFKILVTGAHLSKSFGYTKQHIKDDGLEILMEIETLIDSDSERSRLKSTSILLQNSIDVVHNFAPDVMIYAGDREDVIIYALLGTYLNIPTIHFYGGDHEEDAHQDTYIRHATSKLSTYHFVAMDEHAQRLKSLGEPKNRIFNIGSVSLDKFFNFTPLDIYKYFGLKKDTNFALVIFHPLQNENSENVFHNILKTLKKMNIHSFVSYPNSDPGYESINQVIKKYENDQNFIFYKNLPRDLFLSLFKESSFLIGNSSAGIYEAATIKKAVINVGLRQHNRTSSHNVLFCKTTKNAIEEAIHHIQSETFQKKLLSVVNPYGDGQSSKRAYELIKTLDFQSQLLKIEDPLKVNNE